MNLPCLVWTDLRTSRVEPSPVGDLDAYFRIQHVVEMAAIPQSIDQTSPLLSCFEYDYPSLAALKALRSTKQAYPSLPILMLTVYHSEALAVWAFRTRVWDYLVNPLSAEELWSRIEPLLSVLPLGRDAGREIAMPAPLIPLESRFGIPDLAQREAQCAVTYVELHYGEPLRLQDVAGFCNMGIYEFSRAFKHAYGLTFGEYLCRYRLQRSMELLSNPHAMISEVACAVGFPNASHFARMFHQRIGVTPSQYRLNPSSWHHSEKTHSVLQDMHSRQLL
ncbi:DNA-binding response regulator [Pseudomonas cavernae]|uniref:DNA-binding response regulator n=1 Tax=Pseudomonas cavernae TaxID=2320867 RepID=A0A385Z179_9PSED|nr:AraC family transcriptional regulator [Pseudomonas cavernae]AYC32454.1 DNA-binding response regulator [Pseudomonas cavernae]